MVFVQEHGGQDLESFVLQTFDEARSLLVQVYRLVHIILVKFVILGVSALGHLMLQVTVALAVAEAAYEFEHRDLHWYSNFSTWYCLIFIIDRLSHLQMYIVGYRGNILLARKDLDALQFSLEGKKIDVRTFGLVISIIDFTLSRINTGASLHIFCYSCCL